MKDEIKEIIDRLERIDHKEYKTAFEFADSGSFDEMARCFEERKKMANYITNLQEENEDYKSRCEKTIEYIKNNICDIEFMKKQYGKPLNDIDTTFNDIEKLINILQGIDKDE